MELVWHEQLSNWVDSNKDRIQSISELGRRLDIPRETLREYIRGTVNLNRVNPNNLKKLYELTKLEVLNPEKVYSQYNVEVTPLPRTSESSLATKTLDNHEADSKFSYNPKVDARRIIAGMIEVAITLHPYKDANEATRKKIIAELGSKGGGEIFSYIDHLLRIFEREGHEYQQWRAMSSTPNKLAKILEDRYGP